MMEKTTNIGFLRMKYLDSANTNFTIGVGANDEKSYKQCESNLESFLETVDGESEEGKKIQEEFDRIEDEKKQKQEELEDFVKDKGELEKLDYNQSGNLQIYIDALQSKKSVCWNIAIEYGLFHG